MIVKPKLMKKVTAVLITMFMILNIFGTNIPVFAAEPEAIAAWDYTAAPSSADVPATSGALAAGALLTNFKSATPTYSSSSLSINGWDNGANTKYWQISLSTKGYDSLTLSAKTRSSGTGPRDFKLVYSIDNGNAWNDVPNSAYAIIGTTLSNYMPTISLPAGASDVEKLLVRFIMSSNISSRAGTSTYPADETVASGGTSNINNIVVTGTPVTNSTTVGGIAAEPGNGEVVALGSKVALTCETEGAVIMYSLNNSEFAAYDPAAQVVLNTLPAVIKAYGTKAGMANSVISTFNYTQGTVAAVTASPNGGAVILNKLVTLSCTTPNATIKYTLDDGVNWNSYTTPIKLSSLPAAIKAKATAEGLLDSAESTFNFTLRENIDYNIYFGQIHSHTGYSDGKETPDYAYNYAKNTAKVDFLAVTDHSNSFDNASASNMADGSKSTEWVNGHAAADSYTDSTFVGIYAYEMTWSNGTGHINTFNTPGFENRETAKYKNADGLKQYYDILKQFPDSISQLNHPGTTFGDFNDFAYYDPQIDKQISLIEVGNGEGAVGSNNYFPSYEYYTRALDKGWHVSPTNNQDNHLGKWGDANTARTVVLVDSLTRDNIYDAMRNMRTYATEDNDLRIKYTLNGEAMGTIFDEKPASVNIKVELEDPDNEAIGKVSVISNGGKVVESKTLATSKDTVEFNLSPDYSYYYIRVDEADKDIAVTAPVWLGEVDKAGISKTVCSTTLPIKGESLKITSSLFNNETAPMIINSLAYSINGDVINTAPALEPIQSLGTGSYSFDYTPSTAGKYNIDVKLTATINGVEKTFTDVLKLSVTDPVLVTKVVADGSHYNDYVNGYYANNLGNFTAIANGEMVSVDIEKTKLTNELLADAKLLIISAPAKKAGTANGVPYQPQSFSEEDIAVVKNFVDNGGNLLVCGIADYQDGIGEFQTSTQMNKLLQGIGATSRFNNDEVIDNTEKLNNQNFRLAFDDYNMDSPYLNGVVSGQIYSFYSGCSINLDSDALASGKTTWLVKGHSTTESIDSNKNLPGIALPQGSVYALAVEQLSGGGKMFIGGTVYISDFEVKATMDNASQLQNSNYNIAMNILDSIKNEVEVTPISRVRSANKGDVFSVEGTVTAGKTPSDNAFFDTLYIQDETGGINLFPVSGTDIMVGQRVRAVGTVDEYLGDKELRVIDYSVTDTAINPIEPTLMTTKESMESVNGGMLLKIEGIVIKMDSQNIFVDDGSGEARAFVDGYIGDGSGDSTKTGKWDPTIKIGDKVSIVGLASQDTAGHRLRVRNTAEIVKQTIPVTSITLDKNKLIIKPQGTARLTATIVPDNATNKEVKWISDNESVVRVDNEGNVTGISTGMATITAETVDELFKASCNVFVTISDEVVFVTGITMNVGTMTLKPGSRGILRASVLPVNATFKEVLWTSSDDNIAAVDNAGNITAKNAGYVLITATTKDGAYTAQCRVVVVGGISKSFMFDKTNVTMTNAEGMNTIELKPIFISTSKGQEPVNMDLEISSDNPDIASAALDQEGRIIVTAHAAGKATITATSVLLNCMAKCVVNVVPVTGIQLDKTSVTLLLNSSNNQVQLTAQVMPGNAAVREVEYKSDNESIAIVDANTGLVTATGIGSTIITATSRDGNMTAACTVNVIGIPVSDIGITYRSKLIRALTLNVNGPKEIGLQVVVLPQNATIKDFIVTSSNEAVIKVEAVKDENGNKTGEIVITIIGSGQARIVVESTESGKSTFCNIIVR